MGWVINGKGYDLQKFLAYHPGGSHILQLNQGRDCTELFFSYHLASKQNMDKIMKMMERYYIRDSTKEQTTGPFDWSGQHLTMYLDLKQRINSHFALEPPTSEHTASTNVLQSIYFSKERGIKASYCRLIWNLTLFALMIYAHCFW